MPASAPVVKELRVTPASLPEVLIVEPAVFRDDRGFFLESYNQAAMERAGITARFVQDNHSRSSRGILRGLHYQLAPHAQGKLVRVVSGEIFDVAVDVRRSSSTFGRWVGITLSAENFKSVWIPTGFAHGFMVLSDTADVLYKTTDFYAPECEQTLFWDDPAIGIDGPLRTEVVLSRKDQAGRLLADAEVFA